MISAICAHIHNYFECDADGKRLIYPGIYTIQNGSITLPFLADGQYFRIFGSRFNNGVHQYPAANLKDETFDGVIWEMRPPMEFLELVAEIEDWMEKYKSAAESPYTNESVIGVYSYNKTASGNGWRDIFRSRLNAYRHL